MAESLGRVATFSRTVARLPDLDVLCGASEILFRPDRKEAAGVDVVLVGDDQGDQRARRFATQHDKPVMSLSPGFFWSVRRRERRVLSAVLRRSLPRSEGDEEWTQALYGDARVHQEEWITRARAALDFVRRERISRHADYAQFERPRPAGPAVALLDQPVRRREPLAREAATRMLHWVRSRFPGAKILLCTADEQAKNTSSSLLLSTLSKRELAGVIVDASEPHPHALFENVDQVVTVSSSLGFEALVVGRPVTCFGAPFYAGWGLTDDHHPGVQRGTSRSLEQLALVLWFLTARYVHPTFGVACECEDILRLLSLQQRRYAALKGRTVGIGFSGWKRQAVRSFFEGPDAQLTFAKPERALQLARQAGVDRVLVWGQRISEPDIAALCDTNVRVERVEDGFLRSNRLGSDLTMPASLVRDGRGIYYDPSSPSDLEHLLQEGTCSPQKLQRAAAVRAALVRAELTKYNVQSARAPKVEAGDRKVILAVGQVDGDASVRLGGGVINSSGKLLRAIREAHPDAYLLFKPHPDVVAGNRPGRLTEEERALADAVEVQASSLACLSVAHEVHTLTSLLGFEALLRGIPVYTYGLPFYAGWGLTTDLLSCPRRTRRLTLDELTFQTLIAYPAYISTRTGYHAEVEEVIYELEQAKGRGNAGVHPSFMRQLGRALRYLRGAFDAF